MAEQPREHGSKLSDLLTTTNIIVGASALAVLGVGAAIILSSGRSEDKEKKKSKKKRKEVQSRYEAEEVKEPAPKPKGKANKTLEASPYSYETETPGAPNPRSKPKPAAATSTASKPASKPAASEAHSTATPASSKPAAATAPEKSASDQKLSHEEAKKWLRTYPSHKKVDALTHVLFSLGEAMAKKQSELAEDDIEGDLELTFDRWFLTGFLAALINSHTDSVLESIIAVLRAIPPEEAEEIDTPGICFHALILSREAAALQIAFRLWLAQLPEEAAKELKENQAAEQFEAFLDEFTESSESYAVLTLFGQYHGGAKAGFELLNTAMEVLKDFAANTEGEEGKDELFKGTKFAFQRFEYYSPSGAEYLKGYAVSKDCNDEFTRSCIQEALAAGPTPPQAD